LPSPFEAACPRFKQKTGMVRDEYPCLTGHLSLGQELCQAIEKTLSVPFIQEYLSTLYSPDHDVMQHAGRVQTSLPWHDTLLPQGSGPRQFIFLPASRFPCCFEMLVLSLY